MKPLIPFWEKSDMEQMVQAPLFIQEFQIIAKAIADRLQKIYPREDVEPNVMMALYRAAYSWKPGVATFYWWFRKQVWFQTSVFRFRRRRRAKCNTVVMHLTTEMIDEQFGYNVNLQEIDYKDTNSKDTNSPKRCSRNLYSNNTSGYTGIHWEKRAQKWRAQINKNDKKVWTKYFKDKEQAKIERDMKLKFYE